MNSNSKVVAKIIATIILLMILYFIIGAFIFFLENLKNFISGDIDFDLDLVLKTPLENTTISISLSVLGLFGIIYLIWIKPMKFSVKKTRNNKPVKSKQNSHGDAELLSIKEKSKLFGTYTRGILKSGGVVFGKLKDNGTVYYDKGDTHTCVIGSTGSGKSRRVWLPSIWLTAKSGESMVISDPKRELFAYTYPYLKKQGYTVVNLDLRDITNSIQTNPLLPVRQAIKEKKIDEAQKRAREIVTMLVPDHQKTEPIWTNGQRAIIEACALYVCCDAQSDEEATFYNVYTMITKYGKILPGHNESELSKIFSLLDDTHPAKRIFGVAELAVDKTRSSFYTSAASTLLLYNSHDIAELTQKQTFDFKDIAKKKVALFLNIPDERSDLHSFASLVINQIYLDLVDYAYQERAGRLARKVICLLDEFGNLPKIPNFINKITIARSIGIRFVLCLQSFAQLDEKYGKDEARTIKGNLTNTVYLRTTDQATAEELSKRSGVYTIDTISSGLSTQHDSMYRSTSSSNMSVAGRALYLPQEITNMPSDRTLVFTAGNYPAEFYCPDLSKWQANFDFGIGQSSNSNSNVMYERLAKLKHRELTPIVCYVPSIYRTDNQQKGAIMPKNTRPAKDNKPQITDEQILKGDL